MSRAGVDIGVFLAAPPHSVALTKGRPTSPWVLALPPFKLPSSPRPAPVFLVKPRPVLGLRRCGTVASCNLCATVSTDNEGALQVATWSVACSCC